MRREILALLLVVISCRSNSPGSSGATATSVSTPASGIAFLTRPLADKKIEIADFRGDTGGDIYVTTQSADDGSWSVDLGARYGDFIVRIMSDSQETPRPLQRVLVGVPLRDGVAGAAITGVTHLTAALTRLYVRDGQDLASSYGTAKRLIQTHFGGIDHSTIVPVDVSTLMPPTPALDDRIIVGVIAEFLEHLVAMISDENDAGLSLTVGMLIDLLAQDIEADGVFDGRGNGGQQLRLGNTPLDGETLRSKLALAGLRWLDSQKNTAGFRESDVRALLRAIANADSVIFPGRGVGLDDTAPTVTWLAPSDEGTISGEIVVTVTASDVSPIRSFEFTQPSSLAGTEAMIEESLANGGTARLSAPLDTASFDDGGLTFEVSVADLYGNRRSSSIRVHNNNIAPKISPVAPVDGATLSGIVRFEATAMDSDGIKYLRLIAPSGGLQDEDPAPDKLSILWDSKTAVDGHIVFSYESEDSLGRGAKTDFGGVVDNVPNGLVSGVAWLDSQIDGAEIDSIAFDGDCGADNEIVSLCSEPCRTNTAGFFQLPMSDSYSGPVCFRVHSSASNPASYTDTTTGTSVALSADDELLSVITMYQAGSTVGDVVIDGLTTVATTNAISKITRREDTAAFASSADLFGELLNRDRPVPILRTIPVPLMEGPLNVVGDRERVSIWHGGWSRMGADLCVASGLNPTCLPTIAWIRALRRDCSPVCDGFDGIGSQIYMLPNRAAPIDSYTPRYQHAVAIDALVRGADLGDTPVQRRITGITPADTNLSGGFTDSLSLNAGPLFPPHKEPIAFDRRPPEVEFVAPAEGEPVSTHLRTLDVNCSDNVRIRRCTVTAPAILSGRDDDASPDHIFGRSLSVAALDEGEHELVVTAEDTAGNAGTASRRFVVDRTGPTLAITSHEDGQFVPDYAVELSGTVEDPHGVTEVRVGGRTARLIDDRWEADIVLRYQEQTIDIEAYDTLDNVSTASLSLVVAANLPRVEFKRPSGDVVVGRTLDVIEVVASDDGAINSIEIIEPTILRGRDEDPTPGRLLISNINTATFESSQVTISARATNHVGLTAKASIVVTIDRVPPDVRLTSPHDGSYIGEKTVLLSGTVSDPNGLSIFTVNGSAVTLTTPGAWSYLASQLAEGPNTFVAAYQDSLGNSATQTFNIKADLTDPVVRFAEGLDGSVVGGTFTVEANASDNIALTDFRITTPPSLVGRDSDASVAHLIVSGINPADYLDGALDITLQATDHVGRIGVGDITVIVDRTAPRIRITSHADGQWVSSRTITLSGTVDDANGVNRVTVDGQSATLSGNRWSATLTMAEATQQISVVATDSVGNQATPVTVTLHHDSQDPVIEVKAPAAVVGKLVTIEATATDNRSIQSLRITSPSLLAGRDEDPSSARVLVSSVDTAPFGDKITLDLEAVDETGRSATVSTVIAVDRDGPVIAFTSHQDKQWVKDASQTLTGTVSDAQQVTEVLVNGSPATLQGSTWSRALATLSEGNNPITVVARDALDNSRTAAFSLQLDLQDPTIQVTSPASGAILTDTLRIEASTTDNVQAVSLRIVSPSGVAGRDDDTNALLLKATLLASDFASEGAARVTLEAADHVSRTRQAPIDFIVDKTAPSVNIAGPSLVASTRYPLKWSNVRDTATSVTKLVLSWTGGSTTISNPAQSGSVDITLPECNKAFVISAETWDAAQRRGTTSLTTTCDSAAPTITLNASTYKPEKRESVSVTIEGKVSYDSSEVDVNRLTWDSTTTPAPLYKSLYRSDDTSENVPVLSLGIADGVAVSSVRYQVFLSDNGRSRVVKRAWRDLPLVAGNYPIRFSYQFLGASADDNFVAASGLDDVLTVQVEAVDTAGNKTTRDFNFNFHWMAPPIVVSCWNFDTSLTSKTLTPPTLHEYFTQTEATVLTGTVQWEGELSPSSLAPRTALSLDFNGGQVSSVISQSHIALEYTSGWERIASPPDDCIVTEIPAHTSPSGCRHRTKIEDMTSALDNKLDPSTLDIVTTHTRDFRVSGTTSPVFERFNITPGNVRPFSVVIPNPIVTTLPGNEPMDWTIRRLQIPTLGQRDGYTAFTSVIENGTDYRWTETYHNQRRTWRVVYMLTGMTVGYGPISGTGDHPLASHDYQDFPGPGGGTVRLPIPNVDVAVFGDCLGGRVQTFAASGFSP